MMEYAGWLGNALVLVGLLLIGHKRRSAFLWTVAGETVWSMYGLYRGMVDLSVICALFAVIAAHNYWLWGRPNPSEVQQ